MAQENAKKFIEKVNADEALRNRLEDATKDLEGDAMAAKIVAIAEAEGLPFTAEEYTMEMTRLQDEDLDNVAGGGWGSNDFGNEAAYEACGIRCDWTKNPFCHDKFYWTQPGGKELTLHESEANAIAYYVLNHIDPETKKGMQPASLAEALNYKASKGEDAYKKFVNASKKTV